MAHPHLLRPADIEQKYKQRNNISKEKANETIRVGDDLTDKQNNTYRKLSSAFDALRFCDKIWLIVSQSDNTGYRSLASYTLNRRKIRFSREVFNNVRIKEALSVPTFNDGYYYFFYPRFIIRAKAMETADFNLFPISEIVLKYESHSFKEDPESSELPNDSRILSFTYEKANMDGTPDLRFKDNKKLPIYQYGGINIEALKLKYMFSNAEKAKAFTDTFAEHKAAVLCESKEKESPDLDKCYRKLLYNLCKKIVEVDGKITLSEKEWLNEITLLNDDDPDNDIDMCGV